MLFNSSVPSKTRSLVTGGLLKGPRHDSETAQRDNAHVDMLMHRTQERSTTARSHVMAQNNEDTSKTNEVQSAKGTYTIGRYELTRMKVFPSHCAVHKHANVLLGVQSYQTIESMMG